MSLVKKTLATVWVGVLLGISSVQAQTVTKSDYVAVVGTGVSRDFKEVQKPEIIYSGNFGTNQNYKRLAYAIAPESSGRWKFFLPPGTVGFSGTLLYFLAPQEGKVVLRLNDIPATPLSNVNINHAASPLKEDLLLNLIDGREVLRYGFGAPANSLPLSLPENFIAPMAKGGYVYGNYQYPGGKLQRADLEIIVRADCYAQWFNSPTTAWDAAGNPDENATHTCEGSTGGSPNPNPGPTGTTVEKLLPTVEEGTNFLALNVDLKRTAPDIAGKTGTTYWVAGRVPKNGFFFREDEWFFLTPQGWQEMKIPNPFLVSYLKDETPPAEKKEFRNIPLSLPADVLGTFGVEIYLGYMDNGGEFKNVGIIWKKD